MLPLKRIIIHHSGSRATWYQLNKWWRSLNLKPYYHKLIGLDGQVINGRQDFELGEHIALMNTGSLGICVLGDYSNSIPNGKILVSLDNVIQYYIGQYPTIEEIAPHNKYNDTICPAHYLTQYAYEWDLYLKNIRGRQVI